MPENLAIAVLTLTMPAVMSTCGASILSLAEAVKAMLLGLLVMLLPRAATGPGRQGTILGLLLITAAVALHGDLLLP